MSDVSADRPAGTGHAAPLRSAGAATVTDAAPTSVGQAERPVAAAVTALEQAERSLAAVDRALEALDRGTYGRCAVCGAVIADSDLAGDPTLTTCGEHRTTA